MAHVLRRPPGARRRRRRQGGFTLVELMISLVMFSLAVAGVLSVAVSMVQGYRETRNVIAAETSVRVPMEFLADAIRQISPGVEDARLEDLTDPTCPAAPHPAVWVSNNAGPLGSDILEMVYASGGVVTGTRGVFDPAAPGALVVTNASALSIGDYVLITNTVQGHIAEVTNIGANADDYTLTLAGGCAPVLTGTYPPGSLVIRVRHAIVTVDAATYGVPTLTFDPDAAGPAPAEPLAEGVEDFQVALGIDTTGATGVLEQLGGAGDDDDWVYNNALDTDPLLSPPPAPRAVRFTLIARTLPLPGAAATSNRKAAEDHTPGLGDMYRRRYLQSTVELRNTKGSP